MDIKIKKFTLAALTQELEVRIDGDPNCLIEGVCSIQHAKPGCISFVGHSLYRKYLQNTCAAAIILSEQNAVLCHVNKVITPNPYYVYAKIVTFFKEPTQTVQGIHPSVVIGNHCHIDPSVYIGAHSVIGDRVTIGQRVVIGAGCYIEHDVSIGAGTHLNAHVVLGDHVQIGQHVYLASGVVIGSDGFGFAQHNKMSHKIHQLGRVIIGDEVDIGANTTIDRGTIEDTIIEKGVKLDNQIQVGHNVRIGENTIISGCTGIAGTAIIGKNCMIGGGCRINGHITITDNVFLTATTCVSKSILVPGTYSSGLFNLSINKHWRKFNAKLKQIIAHELKDST